MIVKDVINVTQIITCMFINKGKSSAVLVSNIRWNIMSLSFCLIGYKSLKEHTVALTGYSVKLNYVIDLTYQNN